MEQTPKTSFIPKQSVGAQAQKNNQRKRFSLLGFVAVIIFLGSLTLSIGVFFYEQYSVNVLEGRKSELSAYSENFRPGDIERIRELDRRITIVKSLLDQHIVVSDVLLALEDRTQSLVRLLSFNYEKAPSGNAQVTLAGAAGTFNTLALQKRSYARETIFEDVLFSNINVLVDEENGDSTVAFTVDAGLNEAALYYEILPTPTEDEESADVAEETVADTGQEVGEEQIEDTSDETETGEVSE